MRIDAHQHFWRYDPAEYPWISEEMSVLRRDWLPADLEPELRARGIDGCVAVQARHGLEETRFLLELADEHSFIRAVVGWIDLCADDVEARLAEVAHPKLKGVRHIVQDEPDDRFLLDGAFGRGVEIAAGELEPWGSQIRALARHPHVACKLSGMVTEAAWNRWSADDFRPYLDTVFEAFGEDRLLYGSDWPVCLLAAPDYSMVHGLIDGWSQTLDPGAREKIFGLNATRVYGISQP